MLKKREQILLDDGITKLGGVNVGKYPMHHFISNRVFEGQIGWPLKLNVVGDDEWIAGCHRYRKNSCTCALELVIQGQFLHVQNGRKNIVKPGEVFIVHLGTDTEMCLYKSDYALKKTMELSGTILPALLHSVGLDKYDVVRPENSQWLQEKYDEAFSLCKESAPDFMKKCSAIVYEVLLELGRTIVHNEYPVKLQTILSYLEHNIGNHLNIDDLCQRYSISPATLHRMFNRYLGKSPIECFINMKIELAKELLITSSHYSIKEIAEIFGYSNQFYFSTEFRKRVGVSPKAYRLNPGVAKTNIS